MKSYKYKYTIIIPTYNSSKTIQKCLDSIISQINSSIEVLLIDDGSTDNTVQIINKYLSDDVKLILEKHSGPSYARNLGIDKSNGKYLIFVDSDDYLENDFFEKVDHEIRDDIDLLKFNIYYHGDRINENVFNTQKTDIISGNSFLYTVLKENKIFSTPWMYIYKKQLFTEYKLYFSIDHIHEDLGLIPCLIVKAKKMKAIDYKGYNYIYSYGSLSTNQNYDQIVRRANDILFQYNFLYDFFEKNVSDVILKKEFYKYIKKSIISKTKKLHGVDKEDYIKQLKKLEVITNEQNFKI